MRNNLTDIKKNPGIDLVLVIGPNGKTGKALIPKLLNLGYNVRALQYRSEVKPADGMEIVKGSTLDRDSIEKAVSGVDAVCHFVKTGSPGADPFEKWLNTAVIGTANILESARKVKLKRFIAGGADNIFGHVTIPHYDVINENSPKRFADGHYGLFKIVEEAMYRQYYLGFAVPVVITRFGWIWTDDFIETGAGALDKENRQILKKIDIEGKPLIRHDTHIDDVVQGILLSLQKDEAVGENFNFLAPTPYSSTELCKILSEKYKWPVIEKQTEWYSWTMSNEKAISVLGYKPSVNVLDWLKKKLNMTE